MNTIIEIRDIITGMNSVVSARTQYKAFKDKLGETDSSGNKISDVYYKDGKYYCELELSEENTRKIQEQKMTGFSIGSK